MAFTTYAELVTNVADWAARGDPTFTAKVPDFIHLGEARIWRKLRVSDMVVPASLVVPAAQNWVALPSDWLAFKRIRTTSIARIEYMPPDQLDDLPTPGDDARYSVEGRRLLYGTTPAANLTLDIRYYQHPGFLITAGTTWLLTKSPAAYLYAALIEGALFVKNAAKAGEWGALLDKELGELKSADEASMVSGGRLRQSPR